jgi:hypothetical protein
MKTAERQSSQTRIFTGSALILTVVLTSLLAIVGVLFVMVARVNKIATSAILENKELDAAVDTIVAEISEELAFDIPMAGGQEYYDYPDLYNRWLADLEPYGLGGNYYWRQISDVTGDLQGYATNVRARVIRDYEPITDFNSPVVTADADGDGVGDSKWVRLRDISSSQGKPIYAAVRIIDNGAMLNVNTAYKLDPGGGQRRIDGSSQMQINMMALAGRPGTPPTAAEETALLLARANYDNAIAFDLDQYERNVIWRYDEPNSPYTPFDISDELELRYRFLLNHQNIHARIEQLGAPNYWTKAFRIGSEVPIGSPGSSKTIHDWFDYAAADTDLSAQGPNYDYRHLATTCSMDRIIDPNGQRMVNINTAALNQIHQALLTSINRADRDQIAAQLAVNIVDYRDADIDVTTLAVGPRTYYGFEAQPFVTDIAFRISASDPSIRTNNYFALELYNPFNVDIPLGTFRLELRRNNAVVGTINLTGYAIAANGRFVITNSASASSQFGVAGLMPTGLGKEDSNLVLATYVMVSPDPPTYALSDRYDIYLLRTAAATDLCLDQQKTEDAWFAWDTARGRSQFYCRPDINWNVIYQDLQPTTNMLGRPNGLAPNRKNYNLENSAGRLVTAGDIARVLIVGPSPDPGDMIGVRTALEPPEDLIRLDLASPAFAGIFQYLTVIDPIDHGWPAIANETRMKGRININTAPWFVIAQLPWMRPPIAQTIVAYRDKAAVPGGPDYSSRPGPRGFKSIADLMQVTEMGFYAADPADLAGFPDLTPRDGAGEDFEERDMIFSRISNLVTVRSEVFTACILVRIGIDGPQKRAIAILDRSLVNSPAGKVRIVALQPVPDPR